MIRFRVLPLVLLASSLLGLTNGAQPVLAQDSHEHTGALRGGLLGGAARESHSAPEISPALAASGLLLLIGGTFVLLGGRRSRQSEG